MSEITKALRRPLPPKAIRQNQDNPNLSSVNSAYVIERLNDVFGEDGWEASFEIIEQGAHIVVKCSFVAWFPAHLPGNNPGRTIRRLTFGGNTNTDRGDAYKGACTDALTKAASQIGIASAVYKGMHDTEFQKAEPRIEPATGEKITAVEHSSFWSAARKSGKTKEQIEKYLATLGVDTADKMPKKNYAAALSWALGNAEAAA
jgi:hypothetical protein